jgi:hypothetical protein
MISDILSDAISDIQDYHRNMPDAYADLGEEIAVVTTVMEGLCIYLDAAPGLHEEHGTLVEDLRRAIAKVDVRDVQAARDRLLQFVHAPGDGSVESEQSGPEEWQPLGFVTIDTARLLLIDPVHTEGQFHEADFGQIAIPGGDYSAVQVETGMGDGRYLVIGRFVESPFGWRLGEIRVRFLDENGDWLGGDEPAPESEA